MIAARRRTGSLLLWLLIASASAKPHDRLLTADNAYPQAILDQLLQRKDAVKEYLQGEQFKNYVEQLKHNATQQHNRRGILIVAGGRDMFANAAITLHVLRRVLHSKLPVEIVHFGEHELPQDVLQVIKSYNGSSTASSTDQGMQDLVFVTDGLQAAPQAQAAAHHRQMEKMKGFPAKVYALAFVTRFQQVLLLDADSMPLIDPAILFEVATFRRSGNIFWPDLWHSAWVNASIYDVLAGMKDPPWHNNKHHRLVDSGQLLMDRGKLADVLQYLWLLNSHHDWVYKHMHGDKDTFFLAFAMAGKPGAFKQVPCFARDAMRQIPGHQHAFHHIGMVQSLPPVSLGAAIAAVLAHGLPASLPKLPPSQSTSAADANTDADPGEQEQLLAAADDTDDGSSAGSEQLQQQVQAHSGAAKLRARAHQSRRIGLPVFFHRTSFNSKFFPDCLSKEKIESRYCEVQWVSLPLSSGQAGYALKAHIYAFDDQHINAGFYDKNCSSHSNSSSNKSSSNSSSSVISTSIPATEPVPMGRRLAAHWVLLQLWPQARRRGGTARDAAPASPMALSLQQRQPCSWWDVPCRVAAWLDPAAGQQPLTMASYQQQQQEDSQREPALAAQAHSSHQQQGRQLQQHTAGGRSLSSRQQQLLALQQLAGRHMGLPPERGCEALRDLSGEDVVPIPVVAVALFGQMQDVLQQSYEAFRLVRQALKLDP